MSELSEDKKYMDILRQMKRLELENEKLKHQFQNAILLDTQKNEQIGDLKEQLELKEKSLANLTQTLKFQSSQTFLEQLILQLFTLILDFYDQLSKKQIDDMLKMLKGGPLPLHIIALFVEDLKTPLSMKYLVFKTNHPQYDVIYWIDWLVKNHELVEDENGNYQARKIVIADVYAYKDLSLLSLEDLFIDTRRKIALSKDSRAYTNFVSQLYTEIQRRGLLQTSKELQRFQAEIGFGLLKPEYIFEQLTKILKVAQIDESQQKPRPPSHTVLQNADLSNTTTGSSPNLRTPEFKPYILPAKPVPQLGTTKPIPVKIPVPTPPIPSGSSTQKSPAITQNVPKLENVSISQFPPPRTSSPKKIIVEAISPDTSQPALREEQIPQIKTSTQATNVSIDTKTDNSTIFEIFTKTRTGILNCTSAKQAEQLLIGMRTALENIVSGRILFEIMKLINSLKNEETFNKDAILASLDKWENI